MKARTPKAYALLFIILIGFTSLFTDMTYQGARSISGPYLATLGANAAIISIIAGLGELIGHGLRVITGYIADKWKIYWVFIVLGYLLNAVTIPFLAFTYSWELAAGLILTERIGKAIRAPARDTLISHMGPDVGMGWGFGIHKALDQTGGMLGPLLIMIILYYESDYRQAFLVLLGPALLTLVMLTVIYRLFPELINGKTQPEFVITSTSRNKPFWIYLIATAGIAAGYADFPLIAFHLEKVSLLSGAGLPAVYTLSMGLSAVSSLVLGRLFDWYGIYVLMFTVALTALFPPLIFYGSFELSILGVLLWGVGMGAHESLMKSMVASLTPARWRASYFGIFNTAYGIAWFLGSVIIGLLYDVSIAYLVLFSVSAQLFAIPLFIWLKKMIG